MRVRSFNAATMTDAMAQVRAALGPDAIIVSTHRSRRGRGVQITAAIDEPEADRDLSASLAKTDTSDAPGKPSPLHDMLDYHGVPVRLRSRLIACAGEMPTKDPTAALAGALDNYFSFANRADPATRPVMLVGPPGVGKTLCVAKLAARAVLQGGAVTVATTDTVRAGAIAQLEAYTSLLEQPLMLADSPGELRRAAKAQDDTSLVVDSPGTNPFDGSEMSDLAAFITTAKVEPILVLTASADPAEAAETAEQFARIGCRKLIITRLDAARRIGAILSAALAGDLAFTEVSITPSVVQGLRPLNPMSLSRVLTQDPQASADPQKFGVNET